MYWQHCRQPHKLPIHHTAPRRDPGRQGDKLLSHPWSASLLGSTGSTGSASQTRRQRPPTGSPFSLERHLKWASKTADNQVVATGAGIERNFQATRFASAMTSVVTRRTISSAVLATSILLPVIVVAAYSNSWMGNDGGPAEMGLFGPAGSDLLKGNWTGVFDNSIIQAGPFELLPYGAAALLGLHGTIQWTSFYAICMLFLTAAYLVGAFSVTVRNSGRGNVYLYTAVGAAACLGSFIPWAFDAGHPAQIVIPALWIMAGSAARDRHFATVGILIGLSAGWEVWGVLGAPVIFCALRPDLLRAAWGGLATLAVTYGPFLATGHFHMFEFKWAVSSVSLVHILWPSLAEFPWTLRLLQAVFALSVGVGVALAARRTAHCLWLVPLVVLSARLTLDPLMFGYYWIGPAVVVIAAAGFAIHQRNFVLFLATVLLATWLWMPSSRTLPGAFALLGLSAVCAPLVLAVTHRPASVTT